MWKHLKPAWRAICQSPALSTAAIVCLALGIGANTAVFNVAIALLVRDIPGVDDSDRLVAIHRTYRGSCCSENSWSVVQDIRRETDVFDGVEGHYPLLSVTMADAGEPVRIWGQVVSPEYFRVLGTRPMAGRGFAGDESGVVVVSHSLWQRRFGSDPSVLGRRVSLNQGAFTIIGVAPPLFRGPDLAIGADFWVPFTSIDAVMPQRPDLQDRTVPWLLAYARLKPGVSIAKAQAQLDVVARRLAQRYPDTDLDRGFLAEPARAFHPSYRGAVLNVALVVAALVGLVLIAACANVANILLARATGRRKEIAIRVALGASRLQLIREMIVESTVLALLGGMVGVALSEVTLRLASSIRLPVSLPVELSFQADGRVLGFALVLSLATGLIFGLVPALRASQPNLVPDLKDSPSLAGRSRWKLCDALVIAQVAISVVVLVVTSLFLRSLALASHVNPGFRTDGILLVDLDPRAAGTHETIMLRIRERIEALPGVKSATFTDVVPLGLGARAANIRPGAETESASPPVRADVFQTGPHFFQTFGIPLVRGRRFGQQDSSERTALVNATLASRLWPNQDPIGRILRRGQQSWRVIGVVANTRTRTVGEPDRPCLYLPLLASGMADPTPFGLTLVVQTAGDPLPMAKSVREAIRELEPSLALSNVRTMTQHINANLALPRAGAFVFGSFGVIAILLTGTGLYGVISYSVARRTREFGIRFAVGAQYVDVLHVVLAHGAIVTGAGAALGLAVAFAGTRLLRSLLFGVTPVDPASFVIASITVLCVSLAACYIPARKAAKLDPLAALRSR